MEKQIELIKKQIRELQNISTDFIEPAKKVSLSCNVINNSWSGSDLVGHADFFYGNFDIPPNNKRFNIEWGLIHGVPDGWNVKTSEEVRQKIESDSATVLKSLDEQSDVIVNKFDELRKQTIILFSGVSKEIADEIEKYTLQTKLDIFNKYWGRQIITRDSTALIAGRQVPVHKYYDSTCIFISGVSKQFDDFIYIIDKSMTEIKSIDLTKNSEGKGRITYIDMYTLLRLIKIESKNFDLRRLIVLCRELDDNYSLGNYYSCAMLLRAILDHIPPVFEKTNFLEVCTQYGSGSFKDIVRPLDETAKKISNNYLHSQITKKVLVITKTQVCFQANLDVLLNEVANILEA